MGTEYAIHANGKKYGSFTTMTSAYLAVYFLGMSSYRHSVELIKPEDEIVDISNALPDNFVGVKR